MHTSSGVNVASIAPDRPIIEHKFIIVLRKLVGHSSAVKMYRTENEHVIAHLPIMNKKSIMVVCSAGINGDRIDDRPEITIVAVSSARRPTRFNSINAISMPGISAAATVIKLKYLF